MWHSGASPASKSGLHDLKLVITMAPQRLSGSAYAGWPDLSCSAVKGRAGEEVWHAARSSQ